MAKNRRDFLKLVGIGLVYGFAVETFAQTPYAHNDSLAWHIQGPVKSPTVHAMFFINGRVLGRLKMNAIYSRYNIIDHSQVIEFVRYTGGQPDPYVMQNGDTAVFYHNSDSRFAARPDEDGTIERREA